VKRGANLLIDGGTLTSACNDLWLGVEVWGNPSSMQMTNLQGKVELKNGAVIEKAKKAIFCAKNIESSDPDYAYTGGIVDARDATFKNNRFSIMLWPYHYTDTSKFIRCKFQTTEILADGSSPEYFIVLVSVHGIKIEGCDFECLVEGEPDYKKHGRGIFAIDAGFEILPNLENNVITSFENLNCGVFALKVFEDPQIEIYETDFKWNLTGIYASGIETLKLYRNEFLVDIDSLPPGTQVFGGVYLNYCSGYTIEENNFHGALFSTGSSTSIGITINNSGDAYNEIYKNTFSYMDIGTLAQNYNRNIKDPYAGLKFKCNVYNQNEYDIAVTGSQGGNECGISQFQGSPNNPAGNLFSQKGDHPSSDLDNNMQYFDYFHHFYDSTNYDTSQCHWVPRYYSGNIGIHNTEIDYTDTTCASHLASLRNKELNRSLYVSAFLISDSLETMLQQLIDGGNTDDLEMEITFAQPDEALELRDQLLEDSPYLSDTILIKSVEKEDVLAPIIVKEIMVANPQSAKSDQVLEALENRDNPLPEYMISEILQGRDTIAHKEILEADLSWWDLQKEVAMNRLISIYRNDTSGVQTDSIVNLLENANTLPSTYRLMMTYFEIDDTISALYTLNNIPQQFNITTSQSFTHQHWNDLLEVMLELKRDSLIISDLDTIQIAIINNLALFEDLPGCLARNTIHYLGISETGPYYLLPDDQLKEAIYKPSIKKDMASIEQPFFKIYPNPAKNHIIVEYDIEDIVSQGSLTIYSQEGKVQLKKSLDSSKHHFIISTKDWPSGLYFFNFITQNNLKQTGKIIINK
jgi:hypothetical protein